MKKQIKYISAGMLAGMLLCGGQLRYLKRELVKQGVIDKE